MAVIPVRKMTDWHGPDPPLQLNGGRIMTKLTTGDRAPLKPLNPNAAAIDIGSKMHMAAVNPDLTGTPIRAFGTFTHDLHDLAQWFKSCGGHICGDGIHRYLLDPGL